MISFATIIAFFVSTWSNNGYKSAIDASYYSRHIELIKKSATKIKLYNYKEGKTSSRGFYYEGLPAPINIRINGGTLWATENTARNSTT